MGTHIKPDTGTVTVKSPAEHLTGVEDGNTVEIFSTTFSEYFEGIGYALARETLSGAK